ncbi:MAG: hypothetical protein Ct9H300mP2_0510 [Candidatus Neomarinimicrobiota bacterium]|nr:MAG: hypothetical protein Ct9H300mP2_0510 [Candidatus Neomarinimicrobiota bacterium]
MVIWRYWIPIKGHVTGARAGHASNVEFVKN